MRRRWEDEKMWRWEDVKMRRCEDVKRMRRCEDEKMWRWEDVKMWRWEAVKMRRCFTEAVKMRSCEDEDEKMFYRSCEDEKMWRWEAVKMRRCFTDPHYWKNPALRRSREQKYGQQYNLVGGIPTPLKNDGVRQLGWWHSQYMQKNKHVPNHQPNNELV